MGQKARPALDSNLNMSCQDFVKRFDIISKSEEGYQFKIKPSMIIPGNMKDMIKRKKNVGLTRLIGPNSAQESDFIKSLKECSFGSC
jgi:hypothetical protein